MSWPERGLSPLARGNHSEVIQRSKLRGPIPARAGQPYTNLPEQLRERAYPRSRGATYVAELRKLGYLGLSPLARGNL